MPRGPKQINLIRERGLDPARNQKGCSPPLETPFNCPRLKRRGLLRIKSVVEVVELFFFQLHRFGHRPEFFLDELLEPRPAALIAHDAL